ncbi:MAG: hypothetical protein IPH53_14650 [Flavobacteriales bacterium]|nr:hypothetical protein [Flavobacteriales bacterium]
MDQAVLSMATDGTDHAGGQFTTVGTPALAQPFLVALDPVTGLRVSD